MNLEITAVILAGGKSSRMGSDKSLLKLGNKTLIEHVVDTVRPYVKSVLIVTNDNEKYHFINDVCFISDIRKDQGPLMGLVSGISSVDTKWSFVTSCDMPLINGEIIDYLWANKSGLIVTPYETNGYEPLVSLYSSEILPYVDSFMMNNKMSINGFIGYMEALKLVRKLEKEDIVKLFGNDIFLNINSKEDYKYILEVFDGKQKNSY